MARAKELPSLEYLKQCLDYNPETGEFTWKERPRSHFKNDNRFKSWNIVFAGTKAGHCSNSQGYLVIAVNGTTYKAHRLAWLFVTGLSPTDQIDHIDGNRSNNKASNLRVVSISDNSKNQKLYKNNKSGVSGVWWDMIRDCWLVREGCGGGHIGRFKDFFEAVCARKSWELKKNYHQNHGRNN